MRAAPVALPSPTHRQTVQAGRRRNGPEVSRILHVALTENPQLPYKLPGFYKEVRLAGRSPSLLHGTHRVDRERLAQTSWAGPGPAKGFGRMDQLLSFVTSRRSLTRIRGDL